MDKDQFISEHYMDLSIGQKILINVFSTIFEFPDHFFRLETDDDSITAINKRTCKKIWAVVKNGYEFSSDTSFLVAVGYLTIDYMNFNNSTWIHLRPTFKGLWELYKLEHDFLTLTIGLK